MRELSKKKKTWDTVNVKFLSTVRPSSGARALCKRYSNFEEEYFYNANPPSKFAARANKTNTPTNKQNNTKHKTRFQRQTHKPTNRETRVFKKKCEMWLEMRQRRRKDDASKFKTTDEKNFCLLLKTNHPTQIHCKKKIVNARTHTHVSPFVNLTSSTATQSWFAPRRGSEHVEFAFLLEKDQSDQRQFR